MRAIHEAAAWGPTEYLLAAAVDALRDANWQRSGDKKLQRPDPLPRPGAGRRRQLDPAVRKARLRDLQRRNRNRSKGGR